MHWFWWVLIVFLVFLVLLPFLKIKVNIRYYHDNDNDDLNIKMTTFFGLISYKVKIPVLQVDDDSAAIVVEEETHSALGDTKAKQKITFKRIVDDIRRVFDFLEHVIGFHKILKRFLEKISITKFIWKSKVGLGDAALTGTLVGVVWGIKGSSLGIISNYMKLKVNPILEVHPTFQQLTSHTELSCMISFRLGYAIVAGLQVLKHWKKRPRFAEESL